MRVVAALHFLDKVLLYDCNIFHFAQVLASFFTKTQNKRVLLGLPDDTCETDFVLRVCGRYVGCNHSIPAHKNGAKVIRT